MAVAFRTESHSITTGSTPADPGEPAGTIAGDILVALFVVATAGTPSFPAGWTSLYSVTSATKFKAIVGYIVRGSSAASTAFTYTGGSLYREIYILSISGAAASPIDSQSASGTLSTIQGHNPDAPSTTASKSSCLAISGGIEWGGSGGGGWTASAGYTLQSNNAAGNDAFMQTKVLVSAGAENPAAVTGVAGSFSSDYWDGFTITIGPPAASKLGSRLRPRPFAPGDTGRR